MIKGRIFLLITGLIFGTVFVWNLVQRGTVYHKSEAKKGLEFRLTLEEKPFVVIIPSYNNEEYVQKNLWSVLEQEYKNFRVVFIDDASTDGTYRLAKGVATAFEADDKVTFIHNQANCKALYNLYYTIQSLSDDEICVILDGDDWFAHPKVLKELNRYYNDPNVWMSYGQSITYPKYEKAKAISFNPAVRNLRGQTELPQLRTFYASLFKKIKIKDFLFQGEFFTTCWDLAITFPLWEMARNHAVFIPEVFYVYNRETPLNDDKIYKEKQPHFSRYIRSLPSYDEIESLGLDTGEEDHSALIVFSENRPMQLYSFLESIQKEEEDFSPIHVYYTAKDEEFERGYRVVKETFGDLVSFHLWNNGDEFLSDIEQIESKYVTFAKDTLIANHELKIASSIEALEKAGAYAVYFDLGLNISEIPPKVLSVGEGYFVWDFEFANSEWSNCNRIDMTLYCKETLIPFLNKIHYKTISEFERHWKHCIDLRQIGLFYRESKVVNIPYQITKADTSEKAILYSEKELNDRLLEGYKIDISPLCNYETLAREIEFYPHFVLRDSDKTDYTD
jgi:hypothetical protein